MTSPACISHGAARALPQRKWGALLRPALRLLSFADSFLSLLSPIAFPGSLCGAQLPSAEKTWNSVPSSHWRNWSLCRVFLGQACAWGLSTYPAVLGPRPLPCALVTSGDSSRCSVQGKGSLGLSSAALQLAMGNLV